LAVTTNSPIQAVLEGLPGGIDAAMAEWKVPGAGVAVVSDTDVLFCEGFGVHSPVPRPGLVARPR
jgi:hypothetical protein